MQKLLIASHNEGKIAEFKKLMADWPFEIVGLSDIGIEEDIEETGITFYENALIKAEHFHRLTGLPTLSDDGGFEIDFLHGAPGVKSRRWKGYEMTDQEMVDHALMMTASAPADKKGCRLIAILCYIEIGEDPLFVSGSIEGTLTDKQETDIMPGYPFRSIMRLNEGGKIYTEVSEEELRDLSHRLKALNKLRQKLEL